MNKDNFDAYTREYDNLIARLVHIKGTCRFHPFRDILGKAIEQIVQKHRLESLEQDKNGEQLNLTKGPNPHE